MLVSDLDKLMCGVVRCIFLLFIMFIVVGVFSFEIICGVVLIIIVCLLVVKIMGERISSAGKMVCWMEKIFMKKVRLRMGKCCYGNEIVNLWKMKWYNMLSNWENCSCNGKKCFIFEKIMIIIFIYNKSVMMIMFSEVLWSSKNIGLLKGVVMYLCYLFLLCLCGLLLLGLLFVVLLFSM